MIGIGSELEHRKNVVDSKLILSQRRFIQIKWKTKIGVALKIFFFKVKELFQI